MDNSKYTVLKSRIDRTMESLKRNNMQAYYVENRTQVGEVMRELLNKGDSVTVGGSVTLTECGVLEILSCGDYDYYDRYEEGLSRADVEDIFRKAFTADAYVTSANAVTEHGELYNVDGNSNRVAAIAYGPKSVIVICGVNKIVRDLDEAIVRVKQWAAPANAVRLDCDTYCAKEGRCVSLVQDLDDMRAGCGTDARICCNYLVSARQRQKGRIKVILVGEELGY